MISSYLKINNDHFYGVQKVRCSIENRLCMLSTFVRMIRLKLGLTLSTKGIVPHSDLILDYHSPSQY
jgi:hypothetical protein